MTTGGAMSMSDIVTSVSTLVTGVVGWMGEIVNFVTANPLVMTFVTISLVGLGVGLLSRVLGLRG